MQHRERVMRALDFLPTDRVPLDLNGMRSTGISAFAYPKLVAALGLPPRPTRVEDTGQMLAFPDLDVLDALDIDVIAIADGASEAFPQPGLWHPYDFNGRLEAMVRRPEAFHAEPDGTIVQNGLTRMVPASTVFDEPHGGQPLDLSADLPRPDLKAFKRSLDAARLTDERIVELRELCRRTRESSDRAVFISEGSLNIPMGIAAHVGLAIFPMLCVLEPDYVHELHGLATEFTVANARALLPEIKDYVDVIMASADDWGTQATLIASGKVYRSLFLPYHRQMTDTMHALAPATKVFLHSCGAIYDLIDLVIEAGFDVLNPVQWCAGKHSYREWKDKARGRIALWGGGVNSQVTLPLGTAADVAREVAEVVAYLRQDSGYVFCNIHNILSEIAPEKVIAMYRAAAAV